MSITDPNPAESRGFASRRTSFTSFIGRRKELAEVKRRLAEAPLVTLTGPGGVGKTRIALEAVERSRRAFRDGVRIVELASVEDGSRLPQAIVSALDLPDQSHRDPLDKLVSYLSDQQTMILLDNCEHLLAPCAILAETLLRASPGLRILATSREPLRIGGESICAIPPLAKPPIGESVTAKAIAPYDAVRLLVDRARSVIPEFEVTDENSGVIAQLCDRLDGIPLAIELAAARLRSLSVTQIVDRLDKRFSLLTGGNRVGMPRQQTLRALIEWSFDLCTDQEQMLWGRLSVFPGSFDLEAVEQVCGFTPLAPDLMIDLLDRLVAKSIIQTERSGERVRYSQLMTVREYGAEILEASEEQLSAKRRHRDHCLRKAATMVEHWCGPGQAAMLADSNDDHASLVSALEWSANTEGEAGVAAELASLLRYHWIAGGYLSDGRRWLDQVLGDPVVSGSRRGQALWVAAWVSLMQGDRNAAADRLTECEGIATSLGDRRLSAHATQWRGLYELVRGNTQAAIGLFRWCIHEHTELNDMSPVLTGMFQLAISQAYNSELSAALETCERAIALSETYGELWNRSYALWITGLCLWHSGDPDGARQAALQALRLEKDFQDSICTALTIELLSWIDASAGDYRTSAALAAAASAVWSGLGTDVEAFGPNLYRDSMQATKLVLGAIGEKAVADLRRQNTAMTLDAAVVLALAPAPTAKKKSPVASPLSEREFQVGKLVAEGLSNRSIAESLVLSTRTVDGHVRRILEKLDFTSRSQIATWIASQSS